ncbi:hypothetical protein MYP_411 [Sporocytophaga myxococcoides]|uniref:Uncharacterized protein n=1 Tax=Sporocytophaga myxococcoides TaxID=153721 RepID=A0A098L8L9_9BACT|nr:hypothetical protein MYP_411 [Sporocytophaga myxococcoides]
MFPDLTLKTDAFNIDIIFCVNMTVRYIITGSLYMKQGAVKISLSDQPDSNYKFGVQKRIKHSSI